MSCSKLIYCDECTLKNCWWAAKSDESTTCVPSEDDIGNGFSYFVSPRDTDGCAPFMKAPIGTGTPAWVIGVIVTALLLVFLCVLGVVYARKSLSTAIRTWINNRRLGTDVEMVQLNEGQVTLSTAV